MEVALESFPMRVGFDRVCQLSERFRLSSCDPRSIRFAGQRGGRHLTLDRAMQSVPRAIGVGPVATMGSDAN